MFQAFAEIIKEVASYVEVKAFSESAIHDVEELLLQKSELNESLSGIISDDFVENPQMIEANSTFIKHAHIYKTDDNGRIYRCDNELIPNCEYEINGYKYTTDDLGRIVSAEGKVHLKTHKGRKEIKDSKEVIGHGDQLDTDDRGHIIGDQLDGSNGMENIVAQDARINQGAYKKLEDKIAQFVKDGHDVSIKVEPIYGDKYSYRPTEIKYTHIIDGEKNITIFPNGR